MINVLGLGVVAQVEEHVVESANVVATTTNVAQLVPHAMLFQRVNHPARTSQTLNPNYTYMSLEQAMRKPLS